MPILGTGGYNDDFLKFVSHVFNTQVVKCREILPFVINAIDYLNKYTNDCFFTIIGGSSDKINYCGKLHTQEKSLKQQFFSQKDQLYPYLLVNVRSGASFTRVDSKESNTRICGTTIGSSFFWGVLRLLGAYDDPFTAVYDASKGDSSKIDMSVGDIYGGDYSQIGLPANMIASTFGKVKDMTPAQLGDIKREDIGRSLLTMSAVNVLIFSSMIAKIHGLQRVVWIGLHIDMPQYMEMCEQGLKYLTNDQTELMFPRYHSFLGCLGLLLSHGNLPEM